MADDHSRHLPLIHTDRGTSALLIAASLLLLLGLAALAVDIGATKDERGLDQHGADTSALGGALEIAIGQPSATTPLTQLAVDEVLGLVDTNVRPGADWLNCADSDPLELSAADLLLTPATDCISFFKFEKIRVRIPSQSVDAAFGGVVGIGELQTSAFAEASLSQFPGIGSPPPFVAPDGTRAGDYICLRTSSSGPSIPTAPSD